MRRIWLTNISFFIFLVFFGLAGCSLIIKPKTAVNASMPLKFNVVAILPASPKLLFDNAIVGNMLDTCSPEMDRQIVDKNAGIRLTKLLQEGMLDRVHATVITPFQIAEKLSAEQKQSFYTDSQILNGVLDQLGAEALLASTAIIYEDRLGSAYAVDKPAKVAFSAILVERKENKILWHRCYHESQNTLLADLTQIPQFFSTGGRWLTADELLRVGVMKVMQDFPAIENRD
jgi:hypothetical protein